MKERKDRECAEALRIARKIMKREKSSLISKDKVNKEVSTLGEVCVRAQPIQVHPNLAALYPQYQSLLDVWWKSQPEALLPEVFLNPPWVMHNDPGTSAGHPARNISVWAVFRS